MKMLPVTKKMSPSQPRTKKMERLRPPRTKKIKWLKRLRPPQTRLKKRKKITPSLPLKK
jgi:hypothetical protein